MRFVETLEEQYPEWENWDKETRAAALASEMPTETQRSPYPEGLPSDYCIVQGDHGSWCAQILDFGSDGRLMGAHTIGWGDGAGPQPFYTEAQAEAACWEHFWGFPQPGWIDEPEFLDEDDDARLASRRSILRVRVETDDTGEPISFIYRGIRRRVAVIQRQLVHNFLRQPWDRQSARLYYQVQTPDLQVFELYQLLIGAGSWLLDIVPD